MSKEYTIRNYQDEDAEEVVSLLKLSFPDWAKRPDPLEYWKSKYEGDPYGSGIVVAVSNERIIGANINLYIPMKIGSVTYPAQYESESATHPDFRGLGVYKNMIYKAKEQSNTANIKFSYFTSDNPIMFKRAKENNYFVLPHPVYRMLRVRDISTYLKNKHIKNENLNRIGLVALKIANRIQSFLAPVRLPEELFHIENASSFDERVDYLWRDLKEGYDLIVQRDSKTLNWKYSNKLDQDLKIRQAVLDSKVLGFSVLETRKTDESVEGYIHELIALPDQSDVASALIRDACDYFDNLGVNAVHCSWVKGHPYRRLLGCEGFIRTTKIYIAGNFRLLGGIYANDGDSVLSEYKSSRTLLSLGDL